MLTNIIRAIANALLWKSNGIEADAAADSMYSIPPRLNQTKSLFISSGHSDTSPGAMGNGYTEAIIVTEFRDLVADELSMLGIKFSRDGEKGQNLPLRQAVKMAAKHDVAIEWHCNAFSNPGASGVETLCADPGNNLSVDICAATSEVLAIRDRGSKAESFGQHSRLAFISSGKGIIHELFFITNPFDVEVYQINKHELARRIALLLVDHVCE